MYANISPYIINFNTFFISAEHSHFKSLPMWELALAGWCYQYKYIRSARATIQWSPLENVLCFCSESCWSRTPSWLKQFGAGWSGLCGSDGSWVCGKQQRLQWGWRLRSGHGNHMSSLQAAVCVMWWWTNVNVCLREREMVEYVYKSFSWSFTYKKNIILIIIVQFLPCIPLNPPHWTLNQHFLCVSLNVLGENMCKGSEWKQELNSKCDTWTKSVSVAMYVMLLLYNYMTNSITEQGAELCIMNVLFLCLAHCL